MDTWPSTMPVYQFQHLGVNERSVNQKVEHNASTFCSGCDLAGARTQDPLLKREMLYQLGYQVIPFAGLARASCRTAQGSEGGCKYTINSQGIKRPDVEISDFLKKLHLWACEWNFRGNVDRFAGLYG